MIIDQDTANDFIDDLLHCTKVIERYLKDCELANSHTTIRGLDNLDDSKSTYDVPHFNYLSCCFDDIANKAVELKDYVKRNHDFEMAAALSKINRGAWGLICVKYDWKADDRKKTVFCQFSKVESVLFDIHNWYLKKAYNIPREDIISCKYYVDCYTGEVKNSKTKEVIKPLFFNPPTVLLQKDEVKYYNDSDIPCISKDEYGYGTNVLISEERACSKKNVNNKLWMVCLVTNTIPKCLRCEEYSDGGMILNDPYHSVLSSWYKWNNPQKGDDYDTRCKKIAWGIAAYIGYCCWIDEDGELDWKNGTLEDLYREYHDEAIELAKRMNKAYSKAMRHNDNHTMQIIGDDIEEQHIQQEEAFIKQSSELENVLGKPVLDAAKEYLQWLQKDRNLNFVEMSNDGCKNLNLPPQQEKLHYYCQKAIEKKYLIGVGDGYRLGTWKKAQLAYFLKHFPNADGTFPDKYYSKMFGENRLSKAADQLSMNKLGDGKPRGYGEVDELLQE